MKPDGPLPPISPLRWSPVKTHLCPEPLMTESWSWEVPKGRGVQIPPFSYRDCCGEWRSLPRTQNQWKPEPRAASQIPCHGLAFTSALSPASEYDSDRKENRDLMGLLQRLRAAHFIYIMALLPPTACSH